MTSCVVCERLIESAPRYSTLDGSPRHMLCVEEEPRTAIFAIAFDLPNADGHLSGDPCFAGAIEWHGDAVPAFFPHLESAQRFDSDEDAAAFLRSAFSPRLQEFGVVVEVGQ